MASARYLLPQHSTLSGPHTKEDLYILVERGSLARGEIVVDRITKRSHKVGELIDGMPPPRTQNPGGRFDRPTYQEFAGDTPWDTRQVNAPDPETEEEGAEIEAEESEDLGSEDIHFHGHPSWLSFLPVLLLVVILLAAAVISISMGGKYFLLGLGFASLMFCGTILSRQLNEYYVTAERVEVVWGLIGRSSKDLRIEDIGAIDVHQSGLLGFFGVGTVNFFSPDSTAVEVQFKNVRGPQRIKAMVRELQAEAGVVI